MVQDTGGCEEIQGATSTLSTEGELPRKRKVLPVLMLFQTNPVCKTFSKEMERPPKRGSRKVTLQDSFQFRMTVWCHLDTVTGFWLDPITTIMLIITIK